MRSIAAFVCAVSLLIASPAAAAKPRPDDLESGMTKAQVTEIMGKPKRRTFLGPAEALQYCDGGFLTDVYVVVWMSNGLLVGVTSETAQASFCRNYPTIDWGQAPADVRIAIEGAR